MESNYEKWLQQEKRWMGIYRKKVMKKTLLVTLPLTAIVLGVLFGGMTLLNGAPMQEATEVFAGGVFLGIFFVGCFA
ncbi:MAG: hypothetical protein K2H31_00215, partial [Lachnospiraceae bacterium]|nr:hypothetical protein [Lachnospiraceae bacterium]